MADHVAAGRQAPQTHNLVPTHGNRDGHRTAGGQPDGGEAATLGAGVLGRLAPYRGGRRIDRRQIRCGGTARGTQTAGSVRGRGR